MTAILEMLPFKLLVSQEDILSFFHLAASIVILSYWIDVVLTLKSFIYPDDFGCYLTVIQDETDCDRGIEPALGHRGHLMAKKKAPTTAWLHHAVLRKLMPLKKPFVFIAFFANNIRGASARNLCSGPLKVAAWAFGILGDVPALFVLNVDERNEVWWWSHAW